MKRSGMFELNAVVAVATHRSFRAAATELGISPSALSHAIAALEQKMDVRLFHRTTRSVALTETGERFLARIRPALREISEAMDLVNEFRDTPSGTLRINTSEDAAKMILTPVVLEFLKRYPQMRVDLVSEGRLVDIVAEGFDAGIRLADYVPRDMIAVPCTSELRFVVVGAPSYLKDRERPLVPADLARHQCIRGRLPSGAPFRWEFHKHGESVVVEVDGVLGVGGSTLTLEAALSGIGLAYVSEHTAREHLISGRLNALLEDWTPPFPGLCLYYSGHRHVPAGLRAFIDLIKEVGA
ncbi:MAG: lysR [Pseudomonas sp.]|nr:lysR [Pseudomonas sp.]